MFRRFQINNSYRTTPLSTRANVAYFGSFGYEIDLMLLEEEELELIKKEIDFYKKLSESLPIW